MASFHRSKGYRESDVDQVTKKVGGAADIAAPLSQPQKKRGPTKKSQASSVPAAWETGTLRAIPPSSRSHDQETVWQAM